MFLIFLLISLFTERSYSQEVSCSQLHNLTDDHVFHIHSVKSSMSVDQILKQGAYYGSYMGAGGTAGAVLGSLAATAITFTIGPIVVGAAIFGAALGGFACLRTFCNCENTMPINNGTVCQTCEKYIHI